MMCQTKNPSLEPVADGVAGPGFDPPMRSTECRRAGFDPLLPGH